MKEEAGEVIRAVGAWVLVFRKAVNERGGEGALVCKEFPSLVFCVSEEQEGGRCDKRQEVGSGPGLSSSIYLHMPNMESHLHELANRQAKK